jgi:transposase
MASAKKAADKVVAHVEAFVRSNKTLRPDIRGLFEACLVVIRLLLSLVGRDSTNSSIPPSQDPHRAKTTHKKTASTKKSPGGQPNRTARFLKKVENPDQIDELSIDRRTLPHGHYTCVGYESRQVIDLKITRFVTEYRAEVLQDAEGKKHRATFPDGVTHDIQYGASVKAHAIYMSQFQMLPYERLSAYFRDTCGIPLSEGSIFNFNKQAFSRLAPISKAIEEKLAKEPVIHADETGINIAGKLAWMHAVCSPHFVAFFPHQKRGTEAMQAMGILPGFQGVVCHDHWKAYFRFDLEHALCNAHHLRELTAAYDQDEQAWAGKMRDLLLKMNTSMRESGGQVSPDEAKSWTRRYRKILREGDVECPASTERRPGATRGRIAESKSRNLLQRLRDFERETLRFLTDPLVPFTNNRGENDIRMTKVQQKISGCFRTLTNAAVFCRIRSYLLTSQRHEISPAVALFSLFDGHIPKKLSDALK